HCLWTLPAGDSDLSTRLRLIKTFVTKKYGNQLGINALDFHLSTKTKRTQFMAKTILGTFDSGR
nr:hypothetical protein [Calothrix sp. MO_192.B10]